MGAVAGVMDGRGFCTAKSIIVSVGLHLGTNWVLESGGDLRIHFVDVIGGVGLHQDMISWI
jgi:hypothetical protein